MTPGYAGGKELLGATLIMGAFITYASWDRSTPSGLIHQTMCLLSIWAGAWGMMGGEYATQWRRWQAFWGILGVVPWPQ